jgi:hypothetical protein
VPNRYGLPQELLSTEKNGNSRMACQAVRPNPWNTAVPSAMRKHFSIQGARCTHGLPSSLPNAMYVYPSARYLSNTVNGSPVWKTGMGCRPCCSSRMRWLMRVASAA